MLKEEYKKEITFQKRAQTPPLWLFAAWAVLVLLVQLWPGLTWFPLKGNAAVFLNHLWDCKVFLFERVLCLQTHRCHLLKASCFVPDSQTFIDQKKKKKKLQQFFRSTCQATRREKPNVHLSENSPSDTWFEIFPMIDFRSTLWCLTFILKTLNFEILLSLNFSFVQCHINFAKVKLRLIEASQTPAKPTRDQRRMWKHSSSSISQPRKMISSTCGNIQHLFQSKFCF